MVAEVWVTASSVRETKIPGLLVVDLLVNRDRRGWFKENYRRDALVARGVPDFRVVQHNVTYNEDVGVTRGIHAEPWEKYVSVAHGRVFAAIVDLRKGVTFGDVQTFDLTSDMALFIPRGCGNSYQTVERDVVYTYLVNEHWSATSEYTSVHPYDSELAIEWPIARTKAVMSSKDAALPSLSEVVPVESR